MKWRVLFLASIPITAAITIALYGPFSVAVYKIAEPYFGYPVHLETKDIVVRNDAHGDGGFGAKRRNGRSHSGIDIQAPIGTPVYASKSGLAFRGNVPTGYGKYVMIYHPDGSQSFYGHLSDWCIPSVKEVRRGDLIGFVGKTGNASYRKITPHLHFEIRKDGKAHDPLGLMK